MSYSFWRPQPWRPGALAPLPPSYATVSLNLNFPKDSVIAGPLYSLLMSLVFW